MAIIQPWAGHTPPQLHGSQPFPGAAPWGPAAGLLPGPGILQHTHPPRGHMGGGQEGSDLPPDKQTRFPAGELGAEPPSGPALRTRVSSGLDAGLCHGGKSSPNACLPLFWYLALSLQLYYVQHHSLPFLKFPVLFASPERKGGPAREARAVGQAGHVAPRRTQGKRGQGASGREAR